jgi:hypothetical protein
MSVHTLVEYAKGYDGSEAEKAIIELFPDELDFLSVMPFKTAPGGKYGYYREGELPDNMGFRAINEEPTASHGVINELTEQCFPIAGNLDVDRKLIDRHGTRRRAMEERMQVKSKAKKWGDTFIAGNNRTNPREYTGLKERLQIVSGDVSAANYDSRVIANSQASGGGALSLQMLDLAIGHVDNPTAIIMPRKLKTRFGAAQRDTDIGGFITFDKDDMGKKITRYGDLPIYTGYGISPFGEFLPFDEVAYGGGAAVTASIYIVSFGEMGVCGLETLGMEVKDIGLTEGGVYYRTNIEHDVGMCIESPYAADRLTSITDAPIVK